MTPEPASFQPTPPPVSPAAVQRPPRKKAGKKRKAREPKVPPNLHLVTDAEIKAGAAAKKAKRGRPKKAKAEKPAPETIKVTMKEYAELRIGAGAKVFLKAHRLLSGESKATRAAVLAELSKLLA